MAECIQCENKAEESDGVTLEKGFICADCLYKDYNKELEDLCRDMQDRALPVEEWFV